MRFTGARVHRVEDNRILTGRGAYVDDFKLPRMLHASFVRSPFAHAKVNRVEVGEARSLEGVVQVFTGADLASVASPVTVTGPPGLLTPSFSSMATDRVRFVGDLVAIVVAESRYVAEDAAELVEVDYEPLTPVATFEAALDPEGPVLFDELDTNVLFDTRFEHGDSEAVFAAADETISLRFRQHRQANVPIETRGAIASFDPGANELTYRAATQSPHGLRFQLANHLGLPMERVRVLAGDVGGAFGLKGPVHREDLALATASRLLGRPVKWIEDRNEHLLASGQAREEYMHVTAAVRSDGMVLGLKAELVMDQGAYPVLPYPAAIYPGIIHGILPGPYRIEAYEFSAKVVASNKCGYVPYRGPWEIETWVRERLMDVVARRLGTDPVEVRRRNLVDGEPGDRIVTGMSLEGVTSRQTLERAVEAIDYAALRSEQAVGRDEGRAIGIGVAVFIESAPGPVGARGLGEDATVRVEPDGHVTVVTSQSPHGQGHETTLAQVAADEMGVPLDHVRVLHGDTRLTPFNLIGTGGSRSATWASGAVIATSRVLKGKVLGLAAHLLEIDPSDLEIVDGNVVPRGAPQRAIPMSQVAAAAHLAPDSIPPEVDRILDATVRFTGEGVSGSGWSGGTHVCEVEVDLATGAVKILRYLVVEDCGPMINPAVVEGQIRGGVAQGIAGVLYEKAAYDEEGQFLAGTFMDYLLPTASEIPRIEIHHLETPPGDGVEFRGVGEGGAIVAPAALTNAIEDALSPRGVVVTEQYLPPHRVLELAGVVPEE